MKFKRYSVSSSETTNIAVTFDMHDAIKAYASSRNMTLMGAIDDILKTGLYYKYM